MSSHVRLSVLTALGGIAWCALAAHAQDAAKEPAEDDVLAKMQAAFSASAAELVPQVVIFPVTDEQNRVRPDGYALSQAAAFRMMYGPQRRMAGSFPLIQEILGEADSLRSGKELSKETIVERLMFLGSPYHATARLIPGAQGYHLELDFHGREGGVASKQFSWDLGGGDYGKVTGVMGRAVLEHLGRKLTPQEVELLERPQFQDEADGVLLNEILFGEADAMVEFLQRNPTCVLAWEQYLNRSPDSLLVLEQLRLVQDRLQCDRLRVSDAIIQRNLGRPRAAMALLLDLIPTHAGDTYFYMTMTKTAQELADDRLIELIISNWKKTGADYADHFYRATMLKDWGWQARGESLAVNVPPENFEKFGQRLSAALDELQQAVKIHPQANAPHAEMIEIAMAIGLPYEFVNEQFAAARKKQPDSGRVFHAKIAYLRPMWHGTPERLIPFAKECLESGLWEDRVPQLTMQAVKYAYQHLYNETFVAEPFRSPELWSLIKKYYNEVVVHGSPEDQRLALNYYALWGAIGGHYEDVLSEFNLLGYDANEIDPFVFPDRANFLMLWDRVIAATDDSFKGRTAKVRLALQEGRFADVDRMLDGEKPDNFFESRTVQRYRRAADLGRELLESKRLAFSGLQLKHAFDSVFNTAEEILPGEVQDGQYVWRTTPRLGNGMRMIFPASFRRGTFTGELTFGPGIQFVGISFRLRSELSPVTIQYRPESSVITLTEGHWSRDEATLSGTTLRFRVGIGERVDVIEINDKVQWKLERDSLAPGTIAIQAYSDPNMGTEFTIKSLELKLDE